MNAPLQMTSPSFLASAPLSRRVGLRFRRLLAPPSRQSPLAASRPHAPTRPGSSQRAEALIPAAPPSRPPRHVVCPPQRTAQPFSFSAFPRMVAPRAAIAGGPINLRFPAGGCGGAGIVSPPDPLNRAALSFRSRQTNGREGSSQPAHSVAKTPSLPTCSVSEAENVAWAAQQHFKPTSEPILPPTQSTLN